MDVPDRWGPVKLEGDAEQGYLLMADLHRPRLGLRWRKAAGKRVKVDSLVSKAFIQEIGSLATEETRSAAPDAENWTGARLYEDKEPPGRDVWAGYSKKSKRLFQVVYHAHHRDRILTERVLPTLVDTEPGTPGEWSIFDLSCRTPAGLMLEKHRLNAGDLALMFQGTGRSKASLTVRQIAVAKLALQRRPLEKWVSDQVAWRGKHFRHEGAAKELQAEPLVLRQRVVRRRRFFFVWWKAPGYTVLAKHDVLRDRLVIVDATEESLAREVMDSVGWAKMEPQA